MRERARFGSELGAHLWDLGQGLLIDIFEEKKGGTQLLNWILLLLLLMMMKMMLKLNESSQEIDETLFVGGCSNFTKAICHAGLDHKGDVRTV